MTFARKPHKSSEVMNRGQKVPRRHRFVLAA